MTSETMPVVPPAYRQRNPLWFAWRRFTGNKAAIAAGAVLAILILMAMFAPLITPSPPSTRLGTQARDSSWVTVSPGL